jgi:hypothetical protein
MNHSRIEKILVERCASIRAPQSHWSNESDPDGQSEQMRTPPMNHGDKRGADEAGAVTSSAYLPPRERDRIHAGALQPHPELVVTNSWEDYMANCFAFLQSALSAIEQLSDHPGALVSDECLYGLAKASVLVALVALDQCDPVIPLGAWANRSDRTKN